MSNSTLKLGNYNGEILFSTSGTSGSVFSPATGYGSLYYGADRQLRLKDDLGTITVLGAGGTSGSGSSGTSGQSGSSGTSGQSGSSGSSGVSGSSGSSGVSGSSGSSGSTGSSGSSGVDGSSGTSGANGASGSSGSSGSSGTSGSTITINNNANDRLITGSNTVNTLEGESGLTFNGSVLSVNGSLLTANPTGGTAANWKLGSVFTAGCAIFDAGAFNDQVIEVEIAGTTYYIPVVIPNYC